MFTAPPTHQIQCPACKKYQAGQSWILLNPNPQLSIISKVCGDCLTIVRNRATVQAMNDQLNVTQNKPCPKCGGTGRMYDPAEIRLLISHFCKRAGISQNEFAEKLGIAKPYLSQLMNGKRTWTTPLVNDCLKIVQSK